MTQQVREKGVSWPVVAVVATEYNKEYVYWLGWEITRFTVTVWTWRCPLHFGPDSDLRNCAARVILGNSTSPGDAAPKTTL